MDQTICRIWHTQKIELKKNGDKDGQALYKLPNNVEYGKTMKNLRNKNGIKLINKKKDYLKWKSKLYVTKNIWQWFSRDTWKQSYFNT